MAKKTLAMKFLDGKKVCYRALAYPDTLRDAQEVAAYLHLSPTVVYKTLVVSRTSAGKHILVMIPADKQLDLKQLAKAVGEKKLRMASQREAESWTGLQVGGISALALVNRGFQVILDQAAQQLDEITVSAGERGQQITLAVNDLVRMTGVRFADVTGPEMEHGG